MSKFFTLIDQQANFIVIHKTKSISFHDDENTVGLFNQVKKYLNLSELYPVHRLDKMTTGLIIMATSLDCAQQFQHLFSEHLIEKYYLAISDKKPKKKQGLIKGDMGKSRRGCYKLLRSQENPAITQFFSYTIEQGKRLYLLKPHSGKTHQLRVALNSVSAPILGDQRYGGSVADRGYLHAYALQFQLQDKTYHYLCPPTNGELFCQTNTQMIIQTLTEPQQLAWPKIKN